ncbi:MAG: flagellar hook-length control protein FliK, partial [Desulfobacteraceae bacterium]
FDRLAELGLEEQGREARKADENDHILSSSSLPFIDSILAELGLPRDIKENILENAKTDRGLDLDALLQDLRELRKQSFYSGRSFRASAEETNMGKLLDQLNLNSQSAGKEISLSDFIEALEDRRAELKISNGSFRTSAEETNMGKLLDQLNLNSQAAGKEISLSDFIEALEAKRRDLKMSLTASENQTPAQKSGAAGAKASGLQELMELLAVKAGEKGEQASGSNAAKTARSSDLMATLVKNLNLKTDGPGTGNSMASASGNSEDTHFSMMDLSKKQLNELLFSKQNNQNASSDAKSGVDQKLAAVLEKMESGINGKTGSEGIKAGENEGKSLLSKEGRGQAGSSRVSDTASATGASDFKSSDSAKYLSSLKAKPAAKNLPTYVTNQIGKSLFKAINNGQTEMKLQLRPPELGRIMMTIDDAGNGMKVSVMAENHSAREILLSHAHDLKSTLANSGISLESFDVQMGKDFGQSMADARGQSGQSDKKGKNSGTGSEDPDPAAGDPETDDGYSETTGSLHYVA